MRLWIAPLPGSPAAPISRAKPALLPWPPNRLPAGLLPPACAIGFRPCRFGRFGRRAPCSTGLLPSRTTRCFLPGPPPPRFRAAACSLPGIAPSPRRLESLPAPCFARSIRFRECSSLVLQGFRPGGCHSGPLGPAAAQHALRLAELPRSCRPKLFDRFRVAACASMRLRLNGCRSARRIVSCVHCCPLERPESLPALRRARAAYFGACAVRGSAHGAYPAWPGDYATPGGFLRPPVKSIRLAAAQDRSHSRQPLRSQVHRVGRMSFASAPGNALRLCFGVAAANLAAGAVSWLVSLDPSRFLLALFSALSPTRSLCCASALFRFFLTSAFAAALLSLARLPGTSPCDCRSFLRLQPCGCVRFPDAAFACRLRSAFRNRFRIALRLRHSNFACARLELWWPIALSRDRRAGCR